MLDDSLTRDHIIIVRAAGAHRANQPEFAQTLLSTVDDPLARALEVVGMLVQDRRETLEAARR